MSFVWAEIAQVVRVYSSSGPEQLTLENGQLILILSKNVSGWWLGELQVCVDCCLGKNSIISLILSLFFFLLFFFLCHCSASTFKAFVIELIIICTLHML